MSKPRVTITLGRSGQVVERGGSASGTAKMRGGGGMVPGGKRSIGDRLGSNAHGFSYSAGKRQRGDGIKWSAGDNSLHDSRIGRNDLRLKLLRKRLSKQVVEERKQMDPRVKLSKPAHPSLSYAVLHQKPVKNGSSLMREMPSRESAADLYQENSQRNFYSAQSTDGFRPRSSPRNYDEMHPAASFRPVDPARGGQFLRNGMVGCSQPTDSLHFTMKAAPQPARPIPQFAPASSRMQKSSHMGDEPLTVPGLLHRLGLGKYSIIFQAEEVDMTALKQMGDKDLKELGIPMGPRKKIILALLPRTKQQPP